MPVKPMPARWARGGEARSTVFGLVGALVLASLLTVAAIGLAAAVDVDFSDLSRHPVTVFNGPAYAGMYADLTILLWQVPATAALLAAAVVRFTGGPSRMFLFAGVLTAVMVVDEFFLVSEVLEDSAGLSQRVEPVLYAAAGVAFCWSYRQRLGWYVGLVAVAILTWLLPAVLGTPRSEAAHIVQDGATLLGVALWAFVVLGLVVAELRGVPAASSGAVGADADEQVPAGTDDPEVPEGADSAAAPDGLADADISDTAAAADPDEAAEPVAEPQVAAPPAPDEDATTPVPVMPPRLPAPVAVAPRRPAQPLDPDALMRRVTRVQADDRTVAQPVVPPHPSPPREQPQRPQAAPRPPAPRPQGPPPQVPPPQGPPPQGPPPQNPPPPNPRPSPQRQPPPGPPRRPPGAPTVPPSNGHRPGPRPTERRDG